MLNPILLDLAIQQVKSSGELKGPHEPPGYRMAAGEVSRCASCKHFVQSHCKKFKIGVDANFVCDEWEGSEMHLPTPVGISPGAGVMGAPAPIEAGAGTTIKMSDAGLDSITPQIDQGPVVAAPLKSGGREGSAPTDQVEQPPPSQTNEVSDRVNNNPKATESIFGMSTKAADGGGGGGGGGGGAGGGGAAAGGASSGSVGTSAPGGYGPSPSPGQVHALQVGFSGQSGDKRRRAKDLIKSAVIKSSGLMGPTIGAGPITPPQNIQRPNAAQVVQMPTSKPLVGSMPGDPSFNPGPPGGTTGGPRGTPSQPTGQQGQAQPQDPNAQQPPPQPPAPQSNYKPSPLVTLYPNETAVYGKFVQPAPPPENQKMATSLPIEELADLAARIKVATDSASQPSKPPAPVQPVPPSVPKVKAPVAVKTAEGLLPTPTPTPAVPRPVITPTAAPAAGISKGIGLPPPPGVSKPAQNPDIYRNSELPPPPSHFQPPPGVSSVKTDPYVNSELQTPPQHWAAPGGVNAPGKAKPSPAPAAPGIAKGASVQVVGRGEAGVGRGEAGDQVVGRGAAQVVGNIKMGKLAESQAPHGLHVAVTGPLHCHLQEKVARRLYTKFAAMAKNSNLGSDFDPLATDLTEPIDPNSLLARGRAVQPQTHEQSMSQHLGVGQHPGISGKSPGRSTGYLDPTTMTQLRRSTGQARSVLDIDSGPKTTMFDPNRFQSLMQIAATGDQRAYGQLETMVKGMESTGEDLSKIRMARIRMKDIALQHPHFNKIAVAIRLGELAGALVKSSASPSLRAPQQPGGFTMGTPTATRNGQPVTGNEAPPAEQKQPWSGLGGKMPTDPKDAGKWVDQFMNDYKAQQGHTRPAWANIVSPEGPMKDSATGKPVEQPKAPAAPATAAQPAQPAQPAAAPEAPAAAPQPTGMPTAQDLEAYRKAGVPPQRAMQLYSQGVTAQHAADFRRVGGKGNIVNWAQSWDRTGAAADAAAKARSEQGYTSPQERYGGKTPATAIAQSTPSAAQRTAANKQTVQNAASAVGTGINQAASAVGRFGRAAVGAIKGRQQPGQLTGGPPNLNTQLPGAVNGASKAGPPVTGGPEKAPMPTQVPEQAPMPTPVTGGPPKGENAPAQFDPNEPVDISHMPPEVVNQLGGQTQVPKGMLQQFMQQHGQALQAQYGPDIMGKLPQDVMSPEMQNQRNAQNPEQVAAPAPAPVAEQAPAPTPVPEQVTGGPEKIPAPAPVATTDTPPGGNKPEGMPSATPAPNKAVVPSPLGNNTEYGFPAPNNPDAGGGNAAPPAPPAPPASNETAPPVPPAGAPPGDDKGSAKPAPAVGGANPAPKEPSETGETPFSN